jgi:hypothetical protein
MSDPMQNNKKLHNEWHETANLIEKDVSTLVKNLEDKINELKEHLTKIYELQEEAKDNENKL